MVEGRGGGVAGGLAAWGDRGRGGVPHLQADSRSTSVFQLSSLGSSATIQQHSSFIPPICNSLEAFYPTHWKGKSK